MLKQVFKTCVALLAIAATAIAPAWGQNANVSWVLTPYGNLQDGDTVVIVDKTSANALPNDRGDSTPGVVSVTLNSAKDTLTAPAATLKWVVALNNGNYLFRKPGSDYYLYTNNSNTGVRVGTSSANQFTFQSGGPDVPFLKNTSTSRFIGVYNNQNWRCYTSTSVNISGTVISFYKRTVAAPPQPHTVRFAEGMSGWQVQDVTASASATAPAVLQNVMAGDSLVVTAPATLPGKVKSVKAVKYVAPAATVTTAPTATAAYIEVGSTTALVNAGAASGGTMMYAVTTTNVQPASTADFSATRPTAEGRTAGTYYVWYYAQADADHSDSEIAGPVSVPLALTVTWNSSNIGGSYPNGLNVSGTSTSYTKEGITLSANADMNGAEWYDYGDESMNGISFQVNESGGFTFTAPTGKKFIKIEMTPTGPGGWDLASLGTGWAYAGDFDPMTMDMICKVTWTGSAASTVGLLTGADNFGGTQVKSIVFTLIDAQ